jgi:hypothetical protein
MVPVQALGCGPAGWQHAVARLQSERRELSKRCKALQEAAAAAAGAELAASAAAAPGSAPHFHRQAAPQEKIQKPFLVLHAQISKRVLVCIPWPTVH